MPLRVQVLPQLTLRDPFIVASSHWTATTNALKQFAAFRPSAVTLKTTSAIHGGDGTALGLRRVWQLEDSSGSVFSSYCDGPKTLEFFDVAATYSFSRAAKAILPDTALGLSVLQGEKYSDISRSLDLKLYSYVELNMKYSFRKKKLAEINHLLGHFVEDFAVFSESFANLPILVKLPREATRLLSVLDFGPLFDRVKAAAGGIIIANSLRTRVPPSKCRQADELASGVLVGEHLFIDTFDTIRQVILDYSAPPPIIASGGIVDIGGVVDTLAAGATACQLCSIFDTRGVHVLPLMRSELKGLAKEQETSATEFIQGLQKDSAMWRSAAKSSRELRTNEQQRVIRVLSDAATSDQLLHEALMAELDPNLAVPAGPMPDAPVTGLTVAITKGNIMAFVVGQMFAANHKCTTVTFDTAFEFCRRLTESKFVWDVAIVPQSAVDYIARQNLDLVGGNLPIFVAHLGKSVGEVVGYKTLDPTEINPLYHFSGNSSRRMLNNLLRDFRPPTVELKADELIPLFQYWEQKAAILAKKPLTQFYGLLCRKAVADNWGVLWTNSEPLELVVSRRLLDSPGGREIAKAIEYHMNHIRALLLSNPESGVKIARSDGFLKHCAKLLGFRIDGAPL